MYVNRIYCHSGVDGIWYVCVFLLRFSTSFWEVLQFCILSTPGMLIYCSGIEVQLKNRIAPLSHFQSVLIRPRNLVGIVNAQWFQLLQQHISNTSPKETMSATVSFGHGVCLRVFSGPKRS